MLCSLGIGIRAKMINQKYIDFRITYETLVNHEPDDNYKNSIVLFNEDKLTISINYVGQGLLSFELTKLGEGNFQQLDKAGGSVTIVQSNPSSDSIGVKNADS
jgi:hypothetical protein